MNGVRSRTAGGVAAVLVAIAGCGGRELSGPPELRPGRDECAECGMLVHDERYACAFLIERDGRRQHLVYDDIGCMLDQELEQSELHILERYVSDHPTRAWVSAGSAGFLVTGSDRLQSPMGSGMVAFVDRPGAEAARQEFGGEVMDYAGILDARRAWLRARSGATGGP